MAEAMLDLETFSLKAGGVIRSIGLVIFNRYDTPGEFIHEICIVVKEDSCLEVGMHKDPATIRWWEGQSQEAKNHLLVDYKYQSTIKDSLQCITDAYEEFGCTGLWSHGILADGCWITEAYSMCKMRTPWSFRSHRDTRTIYDAAKIKSHHWDKASEMIGGATHDPVVDSKKQALLVQHAFQVLKK